VLVRPSFWLVMAIFGAGGTLELDTRVVSFILVAFVSVLFHELGHAISSRMFGANAWIELYSFGGLTHRDRSLSRWREVLTSAAGPAFGFALGGLALVLRAVLQARPHWASVALRDAVWINIAWSTLNMLPVLPLDGGRVMSGLLGPSRKRAARILAIAVAGAVIFWGFKSGDRYIAILFGLLAFQNIQALGAERDLRAQRPPEPEQDALARGWKALLSGQEQEASRLAHLANSGAQTPDERNAARDLLAWVALADNDPRLALSHLEKVSPPDKARRLTWALALESMQMPDRALPHAEAAYLIEPSETSATLAARLLNRAGRYDDAGRIASTYAWRSPALRDARLADVALARGDHPRAAALYGAAFDASRRPIDAYNAACAHARANDLPSAVQWLGRALDAGFDDLDQLRSDPDLARVITSDEIRRRLTRPN
jgi:Zn-dependent protease